MIEIKVRVAERVHELTGLKPGHLRHHQRQQRVGGDVERHAEEDVGRALIELTGEPTVGDVELEQAVARRQRHLVDIGRVPGRDDEAARVRIAADGGDHARDLIDHAAVGRRPGAPLPAIDRSELAARIRPLVPNGDAMLVEIFDVGVAGEEPEQLVDDRSQVQLLGGGEREAAREVEAHLMTEHRQRAGAGAIVLLSAVGENPFQQVVVLTHGCGPQAAKGRLGRRSLPPSPLPGKCAARVVNTSVSSWGRPP